MTAHTIKKQEIRSFIDKDNTTVNTFRTLTLFGKNTATYKFALCHALLKQTSSSTEIRYEDLQEDFLRELVRHYTDNPHQFQGGQNKLTLKIDEYLASDQSELEWAKLNQNARKTIFNHVFGAYQNVGSGTLAHSHRLFEDQAKYKKITITDKLAEILEDDIAKNIIRTENQARWSVVEEAWRAGIAPNMLTFNKEDGLFYSEFGNKRIGLRSAVDTLLPYQNGRCFYCNRKISKFVLNHSDDFADVDHFFPFSIMNKIGQNHPNPNGVWNLVISCKKCNRGENGKFDAPPTYEYYHKLLCRNVLFFEEHKHSLKNAIQLSLNANSKEAIIGQMKKIYSIFEPLAGWKPAYIYRTEE
ncbi:hypothetical protein VIN01S_00800 [Vibrio inusitatus NBRC 102082]|uniref:Uncharacterized protein n=1 Tax=Vibrio inusitatus NBRC 102082 TaxID=1219070 RepID=A0A4Y3HQC1_9VIBR|nr:HNH endonuclease domain-containing protein [Vibrio inusitatus]GEA49276.1 hypothetical protein VIN01S_00800 [Vibrio inusitatus NBRC 102082]